MNILWSIHLYYPDHCCGSEAMAHHINKFLISKGHSCRVVLHQSDINHISTPYIFEGVEVFGTTGNLDAYRWADVILTHLDYTQFTIMMAQQTKKALVHFVHNDIKYDCIENAFKRTFIAYNSEWIKKAINYNWPSIVLHPPCDVDYYDVNDNPEKNEHITLISLNKNKGVEMFAKIAEEMPDRKFIGVVGGYDEQIKNLPANIEIIENTPDILPVYKRTRILLMPSGYESWGRTATEAMCSGIPVICTPTPGLMENCAEAGIYIGKPLMNTEPGKQQVNRGKVKQWVNAIRSLDDQEEYAKYSLLCRARAEQLRPKKDLEALEQFLIHASESNN